MDRTTCDRARSLTVAGELARRPLGRSALRVTELGFGAAQLGNLYRPRTSDEARAAVDEAWQAGIRYFDTAPHYGLGLSEHRLGEALRCRPRDQYVLSTKVGRLLVPNAAPSGSDLGSGGFAVPDDQRRELDYSADGVRRSIDASLARLRLDRIDVALVHDPDDHADQALAEAIPALVELREQGVIGAVGLGMNQWQVPLRAVRETDVDVVMVAGRWTLLDRSAQPLLDACVERGVSVLAAAPFNSGLLAHDWPADGGYFDYGPAPQALVVRARAYAIACRDQGVALPHAAIAFPLRHPAVASVVTGLGSAGHVRSAVGWVRTPVPVDLWERLGAPEGETP